MTTMKKNIIYGAFVAGALMVGSCSDFLEQEPQGTLSTANVSTAQNADALVTAAYASIGNDDMIGPTTSMWVYGSVRSDDAHKGGGGVSDVQDVNFYEQHNLTQPQQGDGWMHPLTWENLYKSISRANFALKTINNLSEDDFAVKSVRRGELR